MLIVEHFSIKELARQAIIANAVLTTTGGTVGPYQTALRGRFRQYMVTGSGPDQFYQTPQDAIEEFVSRFGLQALNDALPAFVFYNKPDKE